MEQAVELAKKDGKVFDLLATKRGLETERSQFMQLLINRVEASRHLLYKPAGGEVADLNSIVAATLSTFKAVMLNPQNCQTMLSALKQAVTKRLDNSLRIPFAEIDSMLSIFPEMAFKRVAVGSPCISSRDGKMLTIIGNLSKQEPDPPLHQRSIYLSPFS